ncbi:hypothetical protein BC628DRAFT_415732 [Trametes gibbosa]|nr:hypothetical protein BC628DRAFT_415732 [Trametes gibbosa]
MYAITYCSNTVEYTPDSNTSDFDVFFANHSKIQIGERPKRFPIDGDSRSPTGVTSIYSSGDAGRQDICLNELVERLFWHVTIRFYTTTSRK